MFPHFTLESFLAPYIIFAFSLYLAAVPKGLSHSTHKSNKRIILCCLGVALGLYGAIRMVISTRNDMTAPEANLFLVYVALMSWCLYSLFTNHSKLSKIKKIAKVIIYWFITTFFIMASDYEEINRSVANVLNLILPIIAYYTVCDREIKKHPQKEENIPQIKFEELNISFKRYWKFKRQLINYLSSIWKYCINHKKFIIIMVIIIFFLYFLPYYTEYFIDNSGLRDLYLKHR